MTFSVRSVEYFYTRVEDEPGRAYGLLAKLASIEMTENIGMLYISLSVPPLRKAAFPAQRRTR